MRKIPTRIVFILLPIVAVLSCTQEASEGGAGNTSQQQLLTRAMALLKDSSQYKQQQFQELLREIDKADKEEQAAIYSELSYSLLDSDKDDLFRKVNGKAIAITSELRDSIPLANAYWDLAQFYYEKEVMDSAYLNYFRAQKLFSAGDKPFNQARMLLNMAVIQGKMRDYTGSEVTTFQAIELLRPLDKNRQLFYAYLNLGSITKELKEFERAISYYGKAAEYLAKTDSDPYMRYSLLNNMGIVHQESGDHQKAITAFREILQDSDLRSRSPELYAKVLANLGFSLWRSGNSDQGKTLMKQASRLQDSLQEQEALSRTRYNLALYYLDSRDTANALNEINASYNLAVATNNHKRRLEGLKLLTALEPENSTVHSRNYLALTDSLILEERNSRDKFARIRFETEEYIARNVLLENQRSLWIAVAGIAILFAFLIYMVISQRAKAVQYKAEQEQQRANQEIFNLMLSQKQKLEEGKQSEQKRISEELHDGVLGAMNGIRMILLGLNKKMDENAIRMRSEALEKLKDVQEEIRGISHELNAAAYNRVSNFIHSLKELFETSTKASGIPVNFSYDEDVDWDGLPAEVKINLYRCIQEALLNTVKHAEANIVEIRMEGDSQEVEVILTDDGKGFRANRGRKGIGLKNIASRINRLNGSWTIASSPGEGTEVLIRIPLLARAENGVHLIPSQKE